MCTELQKVNELYEDKLKAGSTPERAMFALSWDIEELKALNSEGRTLRTEISTAMDVCTTPHEQQCNPPRKLTAIRKQLVQFIKRVTRFRRKPATHMFVLMISSELRNQKPYALPVQCVPYAGLKEIDIRRLVSAVVKKMIGSGLYVSGMHLYSPFTASYALS